MKAELFISSSGAARHGNDLVNERSNGYTSFDVKPAQSECRTESGYEVHLYDALGYAGPVCE